MAWGGVVLLFVMAAVQWGVTASRSPSPAPNVALKEAVPKSATPREHITDIPGSLWIDEGKPNASDTFVRAGRQRVDLPNLNTSAKVILEEIAGIWTDGNTVLHIDAKQLKGSLTDQKARIWKDIVVRDVSGAMIVLDIGSNRIIILRRSHTLSVSGASLLNSIELNRQ